MTNRNAIKPDAGSHRTTLRPVPCVRDIVPESGGVTMRGWQAVESVCFHQLLTLVTNTGTFTEKCPRTITLFVPWPGGCYSSLNDGTRPVEGDRVQSWLTTGEGRVL